MSADKPTDTQHQHENIFNLNLNQLNQNDEEKKDSNKDSIKFEIDTHTNIGNKSVLASTQLKLQALLLDDFVEQSLERLEFLLSSIETGIRGEEVLISEDVIEFTTYLTNNTFYEKASQLFIDRFDNKFETISKIGSLRRPQIGDLLIDSFCDLIVNLTEYIMNNSNNDTNNKLLEEQCMNLMKLISITSKICVLRHGFTRLFQMYSWSMSMTRYNNNRDIQTAPTSPNNPYFTNGNHRYNQSTPSSPKQGNIANIRMNKSPSLFNMSLANLFLDILTNCIKLNGPEIYLTCYLDAQDKENGNNNNNISGLYPMVHIKSRLSKGWSFTSWMRLKKEQIGGRYNILSFEGLLRVSIECKVIPQISNSVSCSLMVELINFGRSSSSSQKFYVLEDLNISLGRWHFICFSHNVQSKHDNFSVFIDGKLLDNKLTVQYPNFNTSNNNGIFPIRIGGFIGDIGQSFIYETSLNQLTVNALFCVGPTYNPPIYNRNANGISNGSSSLERIAAFPRSVKQRAAPLQPRKYGYLLLPFCYGLNPRGVSEILCLPYGWGYIDICDRKNNILIKSLPHNKSSLISLGGICYVFYWLSPEFQGPNIYTDKQGYNILRFINELINNNLTLLRQLFTMGLSSIKLYILKYLRNTLRSHLILNAIKELLMIVTNCDQDGRKQYFVDGFLNIIMDTNYWIKAPKNVQNMLASYIHTLIETQPKIMCHCLSLTMLFDMIRSFFPNSFIKEELKKSNPNPLNKASSGSSVDSASNENGNGILTQQPPSSAPPSVPASPSKVPNDADPRVAHKLLESAAALVRLRPASIKYSSHRSIALLISKCISKDLRCQILSTYAEMCHHAPDIMFSQMTQKCGFIKILWEIILEKDEQYKEEGSNQTPTVQTNSNKILTDSKVKAAKIIMGFIRYQRKVYSSITTPSPVLPVSRSGHVNKSALDELIHQIGIALGSLPPSMASYSSLLEIVLGKFKLNMPSHSTGITSYTTERIQIDNLGNSNLNENDNNNNDNNNQQSQPSSPSIQPSFNKTSLASQSLSLIPLVSDKDQINLVGALEGLMKLISESSYRIRTRMLMDILSLVKTSDHNQKLFCRQRNEWDKWMVNLISLECGNDDASACNQLVSQIAATIVWRFLMKDDKGWISVMQLLESLNRKILHLIRADKKKQQEELEKLNDEQKASENENGNPANNGANKPQQSHKITQETKLKCRVLHEFLVQVLVLVLNRFLMNQLRSDHDPNHRGRSSNSGSNMNDLTDSSEHIKNRTSKNLISILDITEWVLFNHRFSMLSIPRIRLKQDAKESDITAEMLFDTKDSDTEWQQDEIRNEILLLKRLLSCSLKFISFKNERQLVLRRLLRYLKEILPHKACHLCFDDCINAAREFCNRLQNGGNATHKKKGTKINMKSENNMKTMRIAYSFLKNAYLRYNKRGDTKRAIKIRALQEEVYAFWGPMLFEDKIDPNTANQMNLELVLAEQSLENVQHHIHSLWVFLQHQKWWEYQFQDKNMKKFKIEYSNHEKEEKKKLGTNREQFDRYYAQCRSSFELVSNDELKRLTESKESKRKKKRDISRDLKKYMDFFDEDFQCRFPNENTPDFWELDPRESSNNHTRLLLVRNFKGTSHSHAAVELTHARKRAKSKTASRRSSLTNKSSNKSTPATPSDSNRQGPPATLLKQISHGILKDLNLDDDGKSPTNKPLLQERPSIEDIPEDKETEEKTSLHDRNIGSMESIMSAASITSESDLYSNINENDDFNYDNEDDGENEEEAKGYQSANLSGKKILLSLDAVSISPFFKISGKMYVTEHHLIFEGHEYKENVHEQNAKDQIKLTQQRYEREKKTLLISNDEELIKQLESENKQQEERILAQKETTTSDIIEYEIWSLAHIKHLYPRRYLLRENGLEIWIAGTSKSFFFTFANTKKRGEVINIICKHSPRFLKQNATKDLLVSPLKMLKHLGLTEKWQKRKISNFDYLMELNVLAGRSYNDITQYPVFPWVITDYQSDTIDLNDPNIYRDLSKPIGALNEDRLQVYQQRYQDSLEDTSDSFPPFYYGSHYMSAGIALYYLCRMEPFATLYINLHGGRFEIPDRTFYSILNAWDLSLNNMGDVKEMIPEAYYFPEFLRNVNKFPLGYRTMSSSNINVDDNPESGKIDNVDLPPWANNSPEEYVRIMRQALESDYVSANLHHWIDLIFGYKQRGDESVAAHNVFFYLTYAGAVDPDSISDPTIKAATEQQIYHFGQTPNILFHQPHPQRMQKERCHWLCELYLPYEMDNTMDDNKNKIDENTVLPDTPNPSSPPIASVPIASPSVGSVGSGDIVWAGQQPQHRNQMVHMQNQSIVIKNKPFIICEFKPVEQPSHLNIIRNGQLLKLFDTTERILTFELPMLAYLDPSQPAKSTQLRNIIDATATQVPPELPIFELMPPDWSDSIVYNTFVLSQNGLYGITGGYLDASIKVHWLKDGSTLASVTGLENGHNDIITCLALDHTSQDMLISGAKDGSIVYWTALLKNNKPGRTPLIGKPYRLLSIHYDAVRVIAVNSKVGIIVSAADDGTIALYSIARKRFVREILFEGRKNTDYEESKSRDDDMLREVIKIHISNTGYIIIHSIDETIPYLRVMSINGILIKKLRLNEILFSLKTDATGKILITGGQACKIIFRHIHNLDIIQEITIIENQSKKKLFKKPNHSKKLTSTIINKAILSSTATSRITHSSAWRQQRFSFKSHHNNGHSRKPSINDVLVGQRKHVLKSKRDKEEKEKENKKNKNKNKKRLSNPYLASPRISTHFHGRFASVDGQTILSQSRIIDFDLDPDNTFIIVVMLNLDPKHTESEHKAQLLLYPLPNTRHIHQFDQFIHGSNKVLQTAKKTIWENIINVIESENGLNELNTFQFPGSPSLPDLYLQSNSSNNSAKGGLGDGAKKFISGLKNVTDKIGKKHKERKSDKEKEDKNKDKDNDDNNNVISEKFNQFRSFLGGGGKK